MYMISDCDKRSYVNKYRCGEIWFYGFITCACMYLCVCSLLLVFDLFLFNLCCILCFIFLNSEPWFEIKPHCGRYMTPPPRPLFTMRLQRLKSAFYFKQLIISLHTFSHLGAYVSTAEMKALVAMVTRLPGVSKGFHFCATSSNISFSKMFSTTFQLASVCHQQHPDANLKSNNTKVYF